MTGPGVVAFTTKLYNWTGWLINIRVVQVNCPQQKSQNHVGDLQMLSKFSGLERKASPDLSFWAIWNHITKQKTRKYIFYFFQLENVNVCELCGTILEDEASLENHMKNKHVKRYTCYYCGRMYRLEGSFEGHIRKHEEYWNKKQGWVFIELETW